MNDCLAKKHYRRTSKQPTVLAMNFDRGPKVYVNPNVKDVQQRPQLKFKATRLSFTFARSGLRDVEDLLNVTTTG